MSKAQQQLNAKQIHQIPPFDNFGEKLLKTLQSNARSHSFKKDQTIFATEQPTDYFYLIQSGWVKTFHETAGGDEVILNIRTTDEFFAEIAMLDSKKHSYSAQAVTDVTLTSYPCALLEIAIQNDHNIAITLLHHLTGKCKRAELEIEHLMVHRAPQRIGCFILKLTTAQSDQNSPMIVSFPYDKNLIASQLGMKPETFSRTLNRLKIDTDIEINGNNIVINDLEKLKKYCCGDCSSIYPCA